MKGNRRRRGVKGIDRLSDLPDGILYHILSFLDSKSLVGSSILSRRWRCVWKEVPVLNFDGRSLWTKRERQGLVRHVDQVLSHRSDCNVCKIGILSDTAMSMPERIFSDTAMGMLDRVIKYAASHGIQQLSLDADLLPGDFDLISTCYQSLKVLELRQSQLDSTAFGLLSCLKMLDTLTISISFFDLSGVEAPHDPFAAFSKLENLKLFDCYSSRDEKGICVLKISGLQLLTLEIHTSHFSTLEVFAPKLVSFCYSGWIDIHNQPPQLFKLNLPSLHHATVILEGCKYLFAGDFSDDDQKQLALKQYVNLFLSLHNVESLWLHLDTIELLTQVYDLVKHQPSPFKRLKSLSLLCSKGSPFVPYKVIRYLLEGSPDVENQSIMVEQLLSLSQLYPLVLQLQLVPFGGSGTLALRYSARLSGAQQLTDYFEGDQACSESTHSSVHSPPSSLRRAVQSANSSPPRKKQGTEELTSGGTMEGVDRLSVLPDGILHHILSSLDTKSVVQTSVLSSRWRLVWKQVCVLNFRRSSFSTDLGFVRHVNQVLSSRSNCDVFKISTDFRIITNMGVFGRIMKYAASHCIQELSLLRIMENEWYSVFSDAVALISGCYQSLKILELQLACLDKTAFEMLSRLILLETLTLHSSNFEFGGMDEPHDPFSSFPKLENLQVLHCGSGHISANDDPKGLMISGPRLLFLEIHQSAFDYVEIIAPKLKSFTYWSDVLPHLLPTDGSNWNLPSLNHATINLWRTNDAVLYGLKYGVFNEEQIQLLLKQFVGLFDSLHNVESLSLHLDTLEGAEELTRGDTMEGIDRLSDLPDGILHHILSSLDTKSIVQTSVLSSRWKFVWKQVRVLNFRRRSFGTDLGFMQHVDQVLSSRSDCDVLKIGTDVQIGNNLDMFGRIMEYASSHGVQQLFLLRMVEKGWYFWFGNFIASICGCFRTLKVLEVQGAELNRGSFEKLSGLELLESLTLRSSNFAFSGTNEPQEDPFANFPRLKELQLLHCVRNRRVGPVG
ncbi:unnamed protein product [Linum tenue]|uniref:F-box domain-containing protein n=1 Tax=Linum tenue TaxID=586396 RepID=A0AAV0JXQ8_9ROSI|nr:unnamed protein product [Linum tenue]